MALIEYGNVTCRVSGIDSYIDELESELSYTTGGFGQPMESFTLFNRKNGHTYTGLVPRIVRFCKTRNIAVELKDCRQKPEANADYNLADGITPFDYQQNVFDNMRSRMVVQMATGAGKTLVLAGLIATCDVRPAIIVSPDATLAFQLQNEIAKFIGEPVGIYTGNKHDAKDITVVTPQAALKTDIMDNAKLIAYDECQTLGANTVFETAKRARNAYYRFAVSATPWRDDGKGILIEAAITNINPATAVTASTLIQKGRLTPVEIKFMIHESKKGYCGTYNKTYVNGIVEDDDRNELVRFAIRDSIVHDRGNILVLFNRINHGMTLAEIAKEEVDYAEFDYVHNGKTYRLGNVEVISGMTKMAKRLAVMQAAREGKIKVLLGSTIADKGLDIPILNVLILAGGGKASTNAFQRVGRVIRKYKEVKLSYVYDILDMHRTFVYHSLTRIELYKCESEFAKNMSFIRVVDGKEVKVNQSQLYYKLNNYEFVA